MPFACSRLNNVHLHPNRLLFLHNTVYSLYQEDGNRQQHVYSSPFPFWFEIAILPSVLPGAFHFGLPTISPAQMVGPHSCFISPPIFLAVATLDLPLLLAPSVISPRRHQLAFG